MSSKPALPQTDKADSEFYPSGSQTKRGNAFTLIEMIGALAVIAILATVIISSTPRQIDLAAGNLESTNLVNYAAAFQKSVLRNRGVPSSNNVAQIIAAELGMDTKDVNLNARNNPRIFTYDPLFMFNTNINLTTVFGWQGWTQNIGGAFLFGGQGPNAQGSNNPPYRARLMILSNMGNKPWPNGITNGLSDSDFTALWGLPDGNVPNGGAWSGWSGDGADVKVQRMDLSSLFVHLILYNYNSPSTNQGQYTIDPDRLGATTNTVPNFYTNGSYVQSGVDSYFLKGSVLGLLKSTKLGSRIDANQIINRNTSFDYVQDVWRSSINLGEGVNKVDAAAGNAMWATTQLFLSSPYSTKALNGVTPSSVVISMVNFMSNYVLWADQSLSPTFPVTGSLYNNVYLSQRQMIYDLSNLSGYPSGGNSDTPQLNLTVGWCTNPPASQ